MHLFRLSIRGLRGLFFVTLACAGLSAASLDYYLPDGGPYDARVPTPAAFFDHEVGEWHLRPDQIAAYLAAVAAAAPERAVLQEYGRTPEGRPLLQLLVAT